MQYRVLGKTEMKISALGFGCMRFPIIDGDVSRIDEEQSARMLDLALDNGVNYLDSAYVYHGGNSERFVGEYLKGRRREDVMLATKLPTWLVQTHADFDRFLDEQLERLQTDYLDCYLIHNILGDYWSRMQELRVGEFFDRAKKDGRIRFAGYSLHDGVTLHKQVVDAYDWDMCLLQFNYIDEHNQAGIEGIRYAHAKGMGVIVMEPLRGGNLARNLPVNVTKVLENSGYNRTAAEWALRWVWNHREVSALLSGMNDIEQVRENLAVAENAEPGSMTPAELDVVVTIRDRFLEKMKHGCTYCGYCMPCPSGVKIPMILGMVNRASMFDDVRGSSWTYMNILGENARADKCVECGECEEKCPQGLAIIDLLKYAHKLLHS